MKRPLFALFLLALPLGAQPAPDLATAEVVDLTHAYDEKTLFWPTSPTTFQLTELSKGKRRAAGTTPQFLLHAGARRHPPRRAHPLREGETTADQIPVRQLIAPAVVIDVAEGCGDPTTG